MFIRLAWLFLVLVVRAESINQPDKQLAAAVVVLLLVFWM
jgi:hypothetical protein